MAGSSITVRLPEDIKARLTKATAKLGCTTTEFAVAALEAALEREEARHVPRAIAAAMPRRSGDRVILPEGIVHGHQLP